MVKSKVIHLPLYDHLEEDVREHPYRMNVTRNDTIRMMSGVVEIRMIKIQVWQFMSCNMADSQWTFGKSGVLKETPI